MGQSKQKNNAKRNENNNISETTSDKTIPRTNTNRNTKRTTNEKQVRTRTENEILIQGIRLAHGKTEEQAIRRMEAVCVIDDVIKIIEASCEMMKQEYGEDTKTLKSLIILGILFPYDKTTRQQILTKIHQAGVKEFDNHMKNALKIRELGELERN